jgi:hypothetical protein
VVASETKKWSFFCQTKRVFVGRSKCCGQTNGRRRTENGPYWARERATQPVTKTICHTLLRFAPSLRTPPLFFCLAWCSPRSTQSPRLVFLPCVVFAKIIPIAALGVFTKRIRRSEWRFALLGVVAKQKRTAQCSMNTGSLLLMNRDRWRPVLSIPKVFQKRPLHISVSIKCG